jgi:hypothetical protein
MTAGEMRFRSMRSRKLRFNQAPAAIAITQPDVSKVILEADHPQTGSKFSPIHTVELMG